MNGKKTSNCRRAGLYADTGCKTPPASTRWLNADRTSAWVLLGVPIRRVGLRSLFHRVNTE
ncbi:MAG: hypothetical protein ACQETR_11915 [Thermodesulfobacteriota bacterium]